MKNDRVPHLVRLIDEDGGHLGVMTLAEATNTAAQIGLEVMLVDSRAEPPVFQIGDAGQRKYLASKKLREARLKQHRIKIKELKMRYSISANDYRTKVQHASAFLRSGCKVQVSILLRGREIQHAKLALNLSKQFIEELSEIASCERGPTLEGKVVMSVIAPAVR